PWPPRSTLFPYTTLFRSLDGQFPLAPVHEHGQVHALGPAEVHELIQGAADGAAGVEDVVHQEDRLAGDVEGNVRVLDRRVEGRLDRKSTRLNSSHVAISY